VFDEERKKHKSISPGEGGVLLQDGTDKRFIILPIEIKDTSYIKYSTF
jgi:hypothetical protein